jgi:trehalose 6-phosphate synthase
MLVLSHFAGAAHDLTEALILNPFEPDHLASAPLIALTMPASERKARHSALRGKARRTSTQACRNRFPEALREQHNLRAST